MLLAAMAEPAADDPIPIPAAIRSMLDAALSSGNEAEVSTIVKYARLADPASADAVLDIAQKWRAERAKARDVRLAQADIFDLWTGRAELGGFMTTGNVDTTGVTGLIDLTREGLRWRHRFRASADYQRSDGVTARERYVAAWEPNRKLSDRAYLYGAAQYESDRLLGYDDRVAVSAGLGYSAIRRAGMSLDVELGPAYRYTNLTDDTDQANAAARGTLNFKWQLFPGLSLNQAAAAYVEAENSTISTSTGLSARLLGPLSAQLSYNVQYESTPPAGSATTGTISRASLVYTF
jgi:putative salt-induced outer membrane protein